LLTCKGGDIGDTVRRMLEKTLSTEMQVFVNYNGSQMKVRSRSDLLTDAQLSFKASFLKTYIGENIDFLLSKL
jgi:hypothetical protein